MVFLFTFMKVTIGSDPLTAKIEVKSAEKTFTVMRPQRNSE